MNFCPHQTCRDQWRACRADRRAHKDERRAATLPPFASGLLGLAARIRTLQEQNKNRSRALVNTARAHAHAAVCRACHLLGLHHCNCGLSAVGPPVTCCGCQVPHKHACPGCAHCIHAAYATPNGYTPFQHPPPPPFYYQPTYPPQARAAAESARSAAATVASDTRRGPDAPHSSFGSYKPPSTAAPLNYSTIDPERSASEKRTDGNTTPSTGRFSTENGGHTGFSEGNKSEDSCRRHPDPPDQPRYQGQFPPILPQTGNGSEETFARRRLEEENANLRERMRWMDQVMKQHEVVYSGKRQ